MYCALCKITDETNCEYLWSGSMNNFKNEEVPDVLMAASLYRSANQEVKRFSASTQTDWMIKSQYLHMCTSTVNTKVHLIWKILLKVIY